MIATTLKALRRGSQFYLQGTLRLAFPRVRSPDVATRQSQLTTDLSTPKGWKAELALLADLQRMA